MIPFLKRIHLKSYILILKTRFFFFLRLCQNCAIRLFFLFLQQQNYFQRAIISFSTIQRVLTAKSRNTSASENEVMFKKKHTFSFVKRFHLNTVDT